MSTTIIPNAPSEEISSARSFELAMRTCSPQQRHTLELIKEACDGISAVDGRLSQVNVAKEIERMHGRNIYQTIRNVGTYNTYIKQRALEASLAARSKGKRKGPGFPITDPVAASQIDILNHQLDNALSHIQRLETALIKMQPVLAADFAKLLASIDGESKIGDLPAIAPPPQISTTAISSRVKTELAKLLQPEFLAKFQLRLEDGEIVNRLELTLIGRAAVKFLDKLTTEEPTQDN